MSAIGGPVFMRDDGTAPAVNSGIQITGIFEYSGDLKKVRVMSTAAALFVAYYSA
jgi:hypothetical protein